MPNIRASSKILTDDELRDYWKNGYLAIPDAISHHENELLMRAGLRQLADESPRRIMEADGRTARAVHGMHLSDPLFSALARHPFLLGIAQQILDGDVYVHQSKINAKLARLGDRWEWHQDFIFWQAEDGMEHPRAVNIAVFLTESTPENGALDIIPGSHQSGLIQPVVVGENPIGYENDPSWVTNLTANLKYTISKSDIDKMLLDTEAVSTAAQATSLLIFHPSLVHSSAPNTSDQDRLLLMYTYNRCDNVPRPVAEPRPKFLCDRDNTPLSMITTDDWHRTLQS